MSNPRKTILIAKYWKAYNNTLSMLRDRNYNVPATLNKTFLEFKLLFSKHKPDDILLHHISFVVSSLSSNSSLPIIEQLRSLDEVVHDSKKCEDAIAKNLNITTSTISDERTQLVISLSNKPKDVLFQSTQCLDDEVLICFCRKESGALGIQPITDLLTYQRLMGNKHMILIINNEKDPHSVLSPISKKKLAPLRYPEQQPMVRVEWFTMLSKSFDITRCLDQSKIELYSKEQQDEFLKQHRLKAYQLETIPIFDPIATHFDMKVGDMYVRHESNHCKTWVIVGTDK